jgi:hypothetical protein
MELLPGLPISPLFARLLPFGLDGRVAAFILRADRWDAGAALMEAASPNAWSDEFAAALLTPNIAALTTCRDAAAKTKKEQHCSIVVPARDLDTHRHESLQLPKIHKMRDGFGREMSLWIYEGPSQSQLRRQISHPPLNYLSRNLKKWMS